MKLIKMQTPGLSHDDYDFPPKNVQQQLAMIGGEDGSENILRLMLNPSSRCIPIPGKRIHRRFILADTEEQLIVKAYKPNVFPENRLKRRYGVQLVLVATGPSLKQPTILVQTCRQKRRDEDRRFEWISRDLFRFWQDNKIQMDQVVELKDLQTTATKKAMRRRDGKIKGLIQARMQFYDDLWQNEERQIDYEMQELRHKVATIGSLYAITSQNTADEIEPSTTLETRTALQESTPTSGWKGEEIHIASENDNILCARGPASSESLMYERMATSDDNTPVVKRVKRSSHEDDAVHDTDDGEDINMEDASHPIKTDFHDQLSSYDINDRKQWTRLQFFKSRNHVTLTLSLEDCDTLSKLYRNALRARILHAGIGALTFRIDGVADESVILDEEDEEGFNDMLLSILMSSCWKSEESNVCCRVEVRAM